ncbi:septal ring lytic transglycosylase RlpA family protein [Flavihumibacter fluvii]|uniref:septal ring lytic transglycosylase RlpA family protein n=1 Tax=Flavihumibacter fluvii TaxID=2838157 RepID=UPI001BDE7C9D|nr:septal ring lytic transglycosylase RlpA family protein [Flavihumibacter fluvii]ULQ53482.1 septal ring lytic transglycosylase RlpA family protein [Flavihumibacter fluvii]
MKILPGILIVLSINLAAVATAQNSTEPTSAAKKKRKASSAKIQYGTASYYSNKFNGKMTANGEVYDSKKFTAAHNGLPLGTWVKVTNQSNHRSVVVKINDRLHYKNPRLIDLSGAAAKKLGFTGHGLTKVKVEVLGKDLPANR